MKRLMLLAVAVVGLLATASGCVAISSAKGGNSGMANDTWYTTMVGIPAPLNVYWATKVFYCPPMSASQSTCTEAEMIEGSGPNDAAVAADNAG